MAKKKFFHNLASEFDFLFLGLNLLFLESEVSIYTWKEIQVTYQNLFWFLCFQRLSTRHLAERVWKHETAFFLPLTWHLLAFAQSPLIVVFLHVKYSKVARVSVFSLVTDICLFIYFFNFIFMTLGKEIVMSMWNCDILLSFKWSFEMQRLSWIIWVVLKCNHIYLRKRLAKEDLTQAEEDEAVWPWRQRLKWYDSKSEILEATRNLERQGTHVP